MFLKISLAIHSSIDDFRREHNSFNSADWSFDSTKASKKSANIGRGMNPYDETSLSEKAMTEIKTKEDDFVGQVEEAQSVVRNVCRPLSPLKIRSKYVLSSPMYW